MPNNENDLPALALSIAAATSGYMGGAAATIIRRTPIHPSAAITSAGFGLFALVQGGGYAPTFNLVPQNWGVLAPILDFMLSEAIGAAQGYLGYNLFFRRPTSTITVGQYALDTLLAIPLSLASAVVLAAALNKLISAVENAREKKSLLPVHKA